MIKKLCVMKNESVSFYRYIPNAITCLNLFCGCLSVVFSFDGMLTVAACFIFAAAVFDFFDGFAARWLHAYSEMGKELDSLADMVSFGVAPSCILFILLLHAAENYGWLVDTCSGGWWIAMTSFLVAVFSALRLAKFNIDTRQSESFIGLPTPANALFICSFVFLSSSKYAWAIFTGNLFFLLSVTVVFSYLLVAELPLFSLKFKSFDWKNNKIRYVFIAVAAVIFLFLQFAGLAVVILVYILISVFTNFLCNRKVST